jgi:hypothetical protein
MNTWIKRIGPPLAAVVLLYMGWRSEGWAGVALAVTGIVMWLLLHFNRLMKVLQRASDQPLGYCDSAVMLNAKLRGGVPLLHVLALTKALGEPLSDKDAQPEVFRWTDGSGSHVTCEFLDGKLVKWALWRPQDPAEAGAPPAP